MGISEHLQHRDNRDNAIVLIAEDNPVDPGFLSVLISGCGYSFKAAQNGKEAIRLAKEMNPDIILLDILMPEINGIEACKILKEDPGTRHIPIIMVTTFENREAKVKCLEAGASDFLTKPVDKTELLVRITNLLQLKGFEEIKSKNASLSATIKAIEIAKKEWEQTLDCIDDIVILTDGKDTIIRCNRALKKFTGKPYEEIIGRNWPELFLEYDLAPDKAYEHGVELFHKPTGKWLVFNFYPAKSNISDEIAGTVISIRDFTELKMATEALEITNTSIDNDRKELQFALSDISFILQEVEKNKDLAVRFKVPDSSTSNPIYQIGEHFNNMMNMLEAKNNQLEKAYAELKAAQSRILQQEKMASIGQLAAGVAHEINNPTGFIMSNLGSLQKYTGKLSEFLKIQSEAIEELSRHAGGSAEAVLGRVKEFKRTLKIDYVTDDLGNLIKESIDGTERVKKIVQDLKRFSHVDESEYKMADINSGLESTINIVWNELKYKASVKKEFGNIPMTKCNPGQLNQVFMNILVNAAHAIEKQGEITVKTWREGEHIHISIADTGCGIPEDKLGKIFEPFFTTKEVGKGTGLGLSIAYDIVKKHNGEITAVSETGKGTKFTIKIPIEEG
ncbi:MAG: response regulator [Nitrospirae bacterium]|nr:response regulator [Nitrospirota bacterium]